MEQMRGPVKNGLTSVRDTEKEERKSANSVLGLIYDVQHQRLHKVYKDLTTGRIRIEGDSDEADQELCMSISAA